MSKQTFRDPETGEEIESTGLARWGAGLVWGLVFWLAITGGNVLLVVLVGKLTGRHLIPGRLVAGLFAMLLGGLIAGLGVGLGYLVVTVNSARGNRLTRRVHDGIARRQYLHRQRILRRQEFPHVPDGALSRAQPPGEPEPTAASLSRAEAAEEAAPRLAAGVDTAAGEKEQAVTQRQSVDRY